MANNAEDNQSLAEQLAAEQMELVQAWPGCDAPDWMADGLASREWQGGPLPEIPIIAGRGEIWRMRLLNGAHQTVMVLSSHAANQDGLARVIPVVDCALEAHKGFAVVLSDTQTHGVALVHLLKTIDFSDPARAATYVETAPASIVREMIRRFRPLIGA